MKSSVPKVLLELSGKPLLGHVLDSVSNLGDDVLQPLVVTGFGGNLVKDRYPHCKFVDQREQLGTGHAVQIASTAIDRNAIVLVLYGDVPLTKVETLLTVVKTASMDNLGLLTANLENTRRYGRIVRNEDGAVISIVEHQDASPEELKIREINSGILAVKGKYLLDWAARLSNKNVQGEYYLTDIIEMAVADGIAINTTTTDDPLEIEGVNDRAQLAELERALQLLQAGELMADGVSIADPARIDIRGTLGAGFSVSIDVNTVFEGRVVLGDNVKIEANCIIRDTVIGNGSHIKAFSHIENTKIGEGVEIGPYARLREGTELADQSKIGNFVETKKTRLGEGSKINHLSYAGDSEIGKNTNIGAGTITCNYDGASKHKTQIGDDVFVGSNSALVAPVKLKDGATIGAGSTISRDVSEESLALTRSKQTEIKGWKRPVKNQDKE